MASSREYRDIPYDGAKLMYLVEEIDDKEKLAEIIRVTLDELTQRG